MKHIHFDEINSTQNYLIDNYKQLSEDNYLISTTVQTNGRGRRQNTWDSYDNALAFSYTSPLNKVVTLTSLEVACILTKFISPKANIKLKWPNDILNLENKKCAGILLQVFDNRAFIGIGINWGKSKSNSEYKTGKSHIFDINLSQEEFKNIPKLFYEFFNNNRMSSEQVISFWNQNCAHLNKEVTIIEDDISLNGIFVGLGENGEALLNSNNQIIKVYNGSLIIN